MREGDGACCDGGFGHVEGSGSKMRMARVRGDERCVGDTRGRLPDGACLLTYVLTSVGSRFRFRMM